MNLDQDAIHACADLVGRTGATEFQIGYLHDGVPADQAAWYAHAQYRAKCTHCGGLVALSAAGAMAYDSTLLDGTRWTAADAAKAGQCRWRRIGPRWARGCETAP